MPEMVATLYAVKMGIILVFLAICTIVLVFAAAACAVEKWKAKRRVKRWRNSLK